ncbi:MAG: hypothetical protein H7Y07_01695 [Pyrinomonadaceae bacterium]|nr:hypothetical protein [Sphingobacteriaceae bacterium]
MKKPTPLIIVLCLLLLHSTLFAQSVSFALKTSPNANFVFDTINKYQNGITIPSLLTLKVEAVGTQWDLYVGTSTAVGGFFDINTAYGTSGISAVPVSILQARVSNASRTSPLNNSFFNLTDILVPQYLIGSSALDAAATCPALGTNTAGSYTSQPQCYTFKVDLKATPGLTYTAGSYSLRVDFVLMQDL